jgi:hypothetical protein
MLTELKTNIDEYVKGKVWYWYLPLWAFGAYIFVQLLGFKLGGDMPFVIAVMHSFDFILHEMAHMLTIFLPDIMTAAAGSFSELFLGVLLIWGAFKGKTYFASLFCFLWFMLSCQSTADYMSDARSEQLPLVNFDVSGAAPIHDWNFVFGKLGLLEQDKLIGGTIGVIGIIAGAIGVILAGWVIYKMIGAPQKEAMSHKETRLLHETAASVGVTPLPHKQAPSSLYPTPSKGRLADVPEEDSNKSVQKRDG